MARNSKIKYVSVGLAALVIVAGVITNFVWTQADVQAVDTKIDSHTVLQEEKFSRIIADADDLESEGCVPGKEAKGKIDIFEYRFDQIDKRQEAFSIKQEAFSGKQDIMRRENEKAFREILKRLPK